MILSNIDEKMDENQRDAYSVGYCEGFDVGFQKGREDTLKHLNKFADLAIKIVIIISMTIGVIVIATMSAKAQQLPTISKSETVQQDTIPVSLLVRIQGRPWAFFHDGWEVRKVDEYPGKYLPMQELCDIPGCAVYHPFVLRPGKTYSHLLYLDSRKRPIRKEWVIYQTFKR